MVGVSAAHGRENIAITRIAVSHTGSESHTLFSAPTLVLFGIFLSDSRRSAFVRRKTCNQLYTTTLDAAIHMLDPQPTAVQCVVGMSIAISGSVNAMKFRSLTTGSPQQRIRRCVSNGVVMDATAVGVAEKEEDEQRIDSQDIFDRVVFVLTASTRGPFRTILRADDVLCRPVMGKRGEAGAFHSGGLIRMKRTPQGRRPHHTRDAAIRQVPKSYLLYCSRHERIYTVPAGWRPYALSHGEALGERHALVQGACDQCVQEAKVELYKQFPYLAAHIPWASRA